MDEGGYAEGGEPNDQFHMKEAISAVVDEGFLGEEDDDYEDLYNDVNVGEGFLQTLRKNDELGFRKEEPDKVVNEPPPPPPQHHPQLPPAASVPETSGGISIPGVGGGDRNNGTVGGPRASGRVEGFGNQGTEMGIRGPDQSSFGGVGLRVELGPSAVKMSVPEEQNVGGMTNVGGQAYVQPQLPHVGAGNEVMVRQGGGNMGMNGTGGNGVASGGAGGGGGTILFVGDLHWWTTDAELEAELYKYGQVKEVKFYDEKASGKSKGYCQVEFFDPGAATSCKEGMNGHVFNGRACVVAFASPYSVKRMGEAQVSRSQQMSQGTTAQARRGPGEAGNKPAGSNIATGGNYQGGDNNNRGFGRGNWGRGNAQGMGGRGQMGPMRSRAGGMGGRGIMGNGGTGFGQGMGAVPPMMHPQAMMGQGFDPAFGAPMGRMGSYGGFPGAPTPPYPGMLSSFPPVGGVGLPGVAPHLNPAFFGRGMPMSGMAMMPTSGVDGPNMGMWQDPSMGGWTGEEHAGRAGESSYGEEAASDHQYGEVSHDRAGWQGGMKEKDKSSERDWSGSSDRRYRDEREPGFERDTPRKKEPAHDHEWAERRHRDDRDRDRERSRDRSRDRDRERGRDRERDRERDRYKEEKERHSDHHRYRDREPEHEDEWERGRSSRTHSKAQASHEEDHRSRSRDPEYGKRRRVTSD